MKLVWNNSNTNYNYLINFQAFFNTEYLKNHSEDADLIDKLKDLIASQIPLLEIGIQIHGQRAPSSLAPLQKRIEEQFAEMKFSTEQKYGKKVKLFLCFKQKNFFFC